MYEEKKDKVMRVLSIYKRLMEGDIINKEAEANYYNVTTRSIQKDIEKLAMKKIKQRESRNER